MSAELELSLPAAAADLEQSLHRLVAAIETAGRELQRARIEYSGRFHATPRQSEILDLIAAGLADKEIACRLGLSYGTVRTHLDRFFTASGVRDRAGAAALWVRIKSPD